jgi:hypothetical protein
MTHAPKKNTVTRHVFTITTLDSPAFSLCREYVTDLDKRAHSPCKFVSKGLTEMHPLLGAFSLDDYLEMPLRIFDTWPETEKTFSTA